MTVRLYLGTEIRTYMKRNEFKTTYLYGTFVALHYLEVYTLLVNLIREGFS